MKASQLQYRMFGVLFLIFSAIFTSASISTRMYPAGPDVILLGVSIVAFCQAYLHPHFKEQDERSRLIKERGMFVSYFFILSYMLIFMSLFKLQILVLDSFQTIAILATLTMVTVFISFVIYAKRL